MTLEVHLCEGNPRRGPFDAGPFRVYTESSAPLPADLVPAGRELGRRVARVPPGEARKALRSWSRKASSDGTPELFELGSDPFATLGEVVCLVAVMVVLRLMPAESPPVGKASAISDAGAPVP